MQVVGLVHQGLRVDPGRRPEGRAAAVARQQDIRKVLEGLLEAREGGVCGRGTRSCHECLSCGSGETWRIYSRKYNDVLCGFVRSCIVRMFLYV